MNTNDNTHSIHQDPFGLKGLPMLVPESDGWPAIRQALEAQQLQRRQWRRRSAWMAVAASLVLAVLVTTQMTGPGQVIPAQPATDSPELASETSELNNGEGTVDSLISLSQTLETQLRSLRDNMGSMPANSAIYVAELEDLVAQVDNELSYSPDSLNLWGQRVNLLLDLAQIYQQQWETDYGQMASL